MTPTAPDGAGGTASPTSQITHLRILVAEDHPINRRLCLLQLESIGCHADSAANGVEVMSAIAAKDYDVILMDCHMPEMDGYQATVAIRKKESALTGAAPHRTRILALTANAVIGERERCIAIGMDGFLTKPVTAAQFGAALADVSRAEAARVQGVGQFNAALDQLCDDLGPESVISMVADFAEEIPGRIASFRAQLGSGAPHDLEIEAHALKGISASLGLSVLAASLESLENAAVSGDSAGRIAALAEVENAAIEVPGMIQSWLACRQSPDAPLMPGKEAPRDAV